MKHQFSYVMFGIARPTWSLKPLDVNFELTMYHNGSTPHTEYKQEYQRLCRDFYKNHIKSFTDGSKQEKGAGAAIFCNGSKTHATLPHEATIFSAKTNAISMAVRRTAENGHAKAVIMCDSYSVLQALTNVHTSHPVIRKLIHEVDDIKREGRDLEF